MKRIGFALLLLTLSLLACARTFNPTSTSSNDITHTLTFGGGNDWPGGDQPTPTISATNLMWDFFAAHPKS